MDDLRIPDDSQCEGQMSIYDIYEQQQPVNSLIAVSKVFARAIKSMNFTEWKTFVYALMHIKWKEKNNHIVVFDKKSLAETIGLKTDGDHITRDLKRALKDMPRHSHIEIDKNDNENDGWISGTFISVVDCTKKNMVAVHFTPYFMPLFHELAKENNYITMWADDLFKMSSERSILFYEDLRLHSDTNKANSRIYSTKELKTFFDIPKDGEGSYMSKDNKHFLRTSFERKVIDPICKDFEKCSMINLTLNEDGKPYTKVKNNHGNVIGYQFTWTVSTHPRVATADAVQKLNQDPKTLKIAQDIQNGEKKPKKNRFNNFESTYANENFAKLEKQLLDN